MFVVFPYRSDVVARQFIWGTVGVIAANVAVAALLGFPSRSLPEPGAESAFIDSWVLLFGTINPITWVTAAFTHFGWFHLIFNMVFLWTFGFVVEGLLGWRRFLLLYFALALAKGCLTQLVMLGADGGGAAGASGVIYGLMVISALWSPRSELTAFVWIIVFIRTALQTHVLVFCALWVGLDFLLLVLQGFSMSSELLHVIGALVGFGAGLWMLKKGLVDTEGWDLLSLRRGSPAARRRAELHQTLRPVLEKNGQPLVEALVAVRDALEAGNGAIADEAYARGKQFDPAWILPHHELQAVIIALLKEDRLESAVPRMEEYVEAYPERSVPVRLRLVEVHLQRGRPAMALEQIARLDGQPLSEAQSVLARKLEQSACADSQASGLELE